jgi:hypothetical protein
MALAENALNALKIVKPPAIIVQKTPKIPEVLIDSIPTTIMTSPASMPMKDRPLPSLSLTVFTEPPISRPDYDSFALFTLSMNISLSEGATISNLLMRAPSATNCRSSDCGSASSCRMISV